MTAVWTKPMILLRLILLGAASLTAACSPATDPTAMPARQPAVVSGDVVSPAALATFLQQHAADADGSPPTSVVARAVDGGPAHPRITLVYLADDDFCGSGGCTLLVGELKPEGAVLLGRVTVTRPPIRVLATRTNGMPDLAVTVCGGGIPECFEAALPFDGSHYPSNPTVPPAQKRNSATAGEVVISEALVRLTFANQP